MASHKPSLRGSFQRICPECHNSINVGRHICNCGYSFIEAKLKVERQKEARQLEIGKRAADSRTLARAFSAIKRNSTKLRGGGYNVATFYYKVCNQRTISGVLPGSGLADNDEKNLTRLFILAHGAQQHDQPEETQSSKVLKAAGKRQGKKIKDHEKEKSENCSFSEEQISERKEDALQDMPPLKIQPLKRKRQGKKNQDCEKEKKNFKFANDELEQNLQYMEYKAAFKMAKNYMAKLEAALAASEKAEPKRTYLWDHRGRPPARKSKAKGPSSKPLPVKTFIMESSMPADDDDNVDTASSDDAHESSGNAEPSLETKLEPGDQQQEIQGLHFPFKHMLDDFIY